MAVLAAFVFSGAIGLFVHQKIAYPILADTADSNIVAPVSEDEKLASSETNSSISATCGKDETLVAISNYPGLGIINKIDEAKADFMHGYWYQKMDQNYWNCSHICVQKSANVSELLKDSGLKTAEGTREISVMIDKPEDMLLAYKNNPQQIKNTIVETKPMCLGPNSKDYAPVGSEFTKGGKVIAKIVERKSTYDIQKASSATKSSDAKPGIQSANISAPPTGDGDGAVPGSTDKKDISDPTNQPAPIVKTEASDLESCWNGIFTNAKGHLKSHLGISYEKTSDEIIQLLLQDLRNDTLHPGNGGDEFASQIETQLKAYKKNNGSLESCNAIKSRIANISTERNDIKKLKVCKSIAISNYSKKESLITEKEIILLEEENNFGLKKGVKYNFKSVIEYLKNYQINLSNKRYQGLSGFNSVASDTLMCDNLNSYFQKIKIEEPVTIDVSGNLFYNENKISDGGRVCIALTPKPNSGYVKSRSMNHCNVISSTGAFFVGIKLKKSDLVNFSQLIFYAVDIKGLKAAHNVMHSFSIKNTKSRNIDLGKVILNNGIYSEGKDTTQRPTVRSLKQMFYKSTGLDCLGL